MTEISPTQNRILVVGGEDCCDIVEAKGAELLDRKEELTKEDCEELISSEPDQ